MLVTSTAHARTPRQQRADLRLVGSVVEHHEHAPACQLRPVHACAFIKALGDVRSVDAELAEEPGQDVRRVLPARVRPAEIGVELPAGKLAADPVGDMNRERRLPDTGLA